MDLSGDLCYVSDKSPGFFRQRLGKKFNYYGLKGEKIRDAKILTRIEDLCIPPAWKNVWICPKNQGHLQATGLDQKGRKQYIYHQDWIKICQQNKFSKMTNFGLSLPVIRQKVRYSLQGKTINKEKILATIVWLLEHTLIRVGNEEYSKENNSFGLTTLRNKHVKVTDNEVYFRFRGKSGVNHAIVVSNKHIVKTIKKCIELPGYELFQFIDENNNKHTIDSSDVNLFLKALTKEDFSAKDFRTWGASTLSANNFYVIGDPSNEKELKKNVLTTVKYVAKHLNNTVSVCRNYYIHPTVIETYQKSILLPHFEAHKKTKSKKPGLTWDEYALVKLLQKYPLSEAY